MPNTPEFGFANIAGSESAGNEPEQTPEDPKIDLKKAPIVEDENSVAYLGVQLEKSKVPSSFVPERDAYKDYINDKFSLELQQKIAVSLLQGDPMLIEGGTSIGKTTTVRKMCSELGYEVHYANLNGATDVEDLMGRYIPNPNKTHPEDPEYIFADGKVTSGLRQEEGKKKVIILDEFNASAPNILIRLHEVLDALERGGEVVLSEDASEVIHVGHENTKVIALMNPPGKGYFGREPLDPAQLRRWVYQKEVTELPDSTFAFSTQALFGVGGKTEQIPENMYLTQSEQNLSREQLAEIPGIKEVLGKYEEFHRAAKELIKQRKIGQDQPQPFNFDDRMEPHRISNFVARFYTGDINETFQKALRYYYSNKLENAQDRQKLEELINHVGYTPTAESRRRTIDKEATETKENPLKTKAEKEIADLMASSEIPDSVKEALKGTETILSPDMMEAKAIMGKDFIGPDEAKSAFGVEDSIEAPAIPFSKEELERAKELNQMLLLRLPMTMTEINDKLGGKVKDGKKLLFRGDETTGRIKDDAWFKDEKFLKEDRIEPKWALVSKDIVPETSSKNYLGQTDKMVDYLKNQVFKDKTLPETYQTAIDEFQRVRTSIESTLDSDWKKAAEMLEGLQITELTRQTPAEALYDLAAYFQTNGERLLPNMYTWTKRRSSDGHLVSVGRFESDGVYVSGYRPGTSYDDLGVSFSRSL